jgi:hypothetical protein
MSVMLYRGNTFESVAVYERYVEYRVTDPTLNGWNYEPIFAIRWVEPTEIASAPIKLYLIGGQSVRDPSKSVTNPSLTNPSKPVTNPSLPNGGEVIAPEPGYGLILALMLATIWIRLSRLQWLSGR